MPEDDSSTTFEIPAIEPFQFDPSGDGDVNKNVNLFRGDVNLPVNLVSLPGRNGLDVLVTALYGSNVQGTVNVWNLDAPVGVLGLGWHLPIEMIVSESGGSGTRNDNQYFLVRNEVWNSLNPSTTRWQRGVLAASLAQTLDAGQVTSELATAFGAQALPLATTAVVTVLEEGRSWSVVDAANEVVYTVEAAGQQLAIHDGGVAYELTDYQPWRVRYYPEFERWEITREDGITTVYGGCLSTNADGSLSSLGDSVQWAVRWGNWIGPSTITHDPEDPSSRAQQQYPLAWNRSKTYDPWGEAVLFEYEVAEQAVGIGGLPYTKASYISRVVDEFGRTITFTYGEKAFDTSSPSGWREYQDPYKAVPNDDPDGYQSRYETKYLEQIDVVAPTGDLLYSLVFTSSPVSYATLASNVPQDMFGETGKRTLFSIQKVLPGGLSTPALRFTYYQASDLNAGGLETVTYPKGAVITFTYQQKQLPLGTRSFVVDNPLVTGGTPRVWFGEDYAVVTRYDGQGRLSIGAYTWLGRWQTWHSPAPIVNDFVDLANFHALIEEDFFVLYYATADGATYRVWSFHKDVNYLGAWLPGGDSPVTLQTTRVQAASGDNFYAIADRDSGEVYRYRWDPLRKEWASDTITTSSLCPSADPSQSTLFVTAAAAYLLVFCYDDVGAPGSKNSLLQLWYLDALGDWVLGDESTVADLTISGDPVEDNFWWSPAAPFVAATYATNDLGSILQYAIWIWTWGADGDSAYKLRTPSTFSYSVSKSQPSNQVTIPFVADVVSAGLVASGPHLLRFNGVQWLENDNLEIVMPVVDSTAFEFAYGPDVAIKTENAENQILTSVQAFDPDADSPAWTSAAVPLYDGSPSAPRQTRYYPTAATDFLTWDTNVYGRGTSTDWLVPLQSPLSPSLPSTVNTTTIINQGPSFIAYLVESGATPPVPQATEVVILENGQILTTEPINENFFRVAQGGGGVQTMVDGVSPVGPSSLLTFLPLTANFDEASQLTLHRFVGASIEQPLTDYPVYTVEIFDGYQTISTSYDFDETNALVDSTGSVAKYFSSTVYAGTTDPSSLPAGYTVHQFVNGMPPDVGGPVYPSAVDGNPLKTIGYDSAGNVVLKTDLTWQVFTTVQDLDEGGTRPLFGAFVRVQQMVTTKDGIRRPVNFSYDAATGMPLGNTTVIYNADGAPETHSTAMTYGYEAYNQLRYLNILSPTVQSKEMVQAEDGVATVTSVGASTWSPFPRAALDGQPMMCPGAHKTYRWLGGAGFSDFDFVAWPGSGEPPAAWLKTSEVTVRTTHGLVQERLDQGGLVRSTLFDLEERLPVATFTNASLSGGEAYYYGFEDYEDPNGWQLDASRTPILSDTSHTGARSLRLPAGESSVPLTLTPADQSGVFLVSCWANTPTTYDPANPAGLRVELMTSGTPTGRAVDVPFASSQGNWEYACAPVDLSVGAPGAAAIVVSVTLYNHGAVPVNVDDFAFASFNGQLVANVYQEPFYLVVAEVGPYKTVSRWAYDLQLRMVARSESEENVEVATTTYFSRQAPSDAFDPAVPNINVTVRPAGATFYDRFSNGGDWSANWSSSQPNDWVSESGWLRHTTDTAGVITLTTPAVAANFFVAMDLSPHGPVGAPLGLTVGQAATVLWDPASQRWTLTDTSGPTTIEAPYASSTPGSSWLLVVTDAALLFIVDGRPTFSYLPAQAIAGDVGIITSDTVAFTNVVVGESPEVTATFIDGSGKTRQRHGVNGTASLVSATLYDELGRGCVSTKAATYGADGNLPLLAYRSSFATLDWSTGVMSGDIAASYPVDEGFPYSRQRYESSPLGRVVEVGVPGKSFAILGDGSNSHTLTSRYGTNQAGGFPQPLKLPAGQYFVTTTTDQDGVVSLAVSDSLGQPVARGTQLPTSRYVTSSSSVRYGATGPVSRQFLPNYYNPPDPDAKQAWVVTQSYDMLGRLLSREEPDAGFAQYVYDLRGNRRFWQDAAALAGGLILYAKYDVLGRPLEEGTFPGTWDGATLADRAVSDPTWPGIGDGAVPRRQFAYDGDGSDPTLLGRLTTAMVASLADPTTLAFETSYTYDDIGRILTETARAPGYASQSYVFEYTYDNLSRGASVTYPSGLELVTTRNPLGFVEQIAERNGLPYVEYSYVPTGQVAVETLNPGQPNQISRAYSYNSPGWLVGIDDDVLQTAIQYTENGYRGAGYYSGKIAQVSYQLQMPNPGDFLTAVAYAYDYDPLGRLTNALCTAGGTVVSQWSLGVSQPVSYDDNGNFLIVPRGSDLASYTYRPGSDFILNTDGSGVAAYTADPTGSVASAMPRSITSIDYDVVLRRPSSIQVPAGTMTFDYDARSRRLLKQAFGDTRLYLRGRSGPPLEERVQGASGAGETTIDYLYGPSGLLLQRSGDEARTVVRDHLGSVRAVVDESKSVLAAYQYLPFGGFIEPVFATVPDAIRYLFAGQELDLETGLYNMGARLYDPVLGRFYSTDPARQFASPYVYANNNPVSFTDPTGQFSIGAFFIGALLAVVGIAAIIVTAGADAPVVAPLVGAAEAAEWSATAVGAVQYGTMAVGSTLGGTSLGAGVSGIQYAATHNRLDGSEFGEALAQGALSGAISGGVNFGITAFTGVFLNEAIASIAYRLARSAAMAFRGGLESAASAVPAQAITNVATNQKAESGLLDSFLIGFGTGAFAGGTAPLVARAPAAGAGEAAGHVDADVVADARPAAHDEPPPPAADVARAAAEAAPQADVNAPVARENMALVVWRPPEVFRPPAPAAPAPQFWIHPAALEFMRSQALRSTQIERPLPIDLPAPTPRVLNVPGGRFLITDRSAFNLPPIVVWQSTAPLALPWYGNG